jgi:dihydrofolate reductase
VAAREARGLRHAYVDGGIVVQQFLQAGLIQILTITRIPRLIGSGIPLFGALPQDVVLRHVGTTQNPSGLVSGVYAIDD